jgi:hypothetical protein
LNVTVPVGEPPVAVTVAVKVIEVDVNDGFEDDPTALILGTAAVTLSDTLAAAAL